MEATITYFIIMLRMNHIILYLIIYLQFHLII